MLDWYAARMMMWIGDLQEAGWIVVDTFPSEHFPNFDYLVAATALGKSGLQPPPTRFQSAYADGTLEDRRSVREAA